MEQTSAQVDKVRAGADKARQRLHQMKTEYLNQIADSLPAAIDDAALKEAQNDVTFTNSTDESVTAEMRVSLNELAIALAERVRQGMESVRWPDSEYSLRQQEPTRTAIAQLIKEPLDRIVEVIRQYGYENAEITPAEFLDYAQANQIDDQLRNVMEWNVALAKAEKEHALARLAQRWAATTPPGLRK